MKDDSQFRHYAAFRVRLAANASKLRPMLDSTSSSTSIGSGSLRASVAG
jgi:hypothetical protein